MGLRGALPSRIVLYFGKEASTQDIMNILAVMIVYAFVRFLAVPDKPEAACKLCEHADSSIRL